jgi:hypothetical protein
MFYDFFNNHFHAFTRRGKHVSGTLRVILSMLPTFLKKVIVDNVLDPNNYKSQSWTFKSEVSPDIIQLPNEEKFHAFTRRGKHVSGTLRVSLGALSRARVARSLIFSVMFC